MPFNVKKYGTLECIVCGREKAVYIYRHNIITISRNVPGYMNRKKSTFYPLIQFENKVIVYRGPLVVVDTVIVKKKK